MKASEHILKATSYICLVLVVELCAVVELLCWLGTVVAVASMLLRN